MIKLLPLVACALLLGCQRQYDVATCNDLAMKKYLGKPKESHEYDQNCRNKVDHPITTTVCQKALHLLIVEGKQEHLMQLFGQGIMGCFTPQDLQRFLR